MVNYISLILVAGLTLTSAISTTSFAAGPSGTHAQKAKRDREKEVDPNLASHKKQNHDSECELMEDGEETACNSSNTGTGHSLVSGPLSFSDLPIDVRTSIFRKLIYGREYELASRDLNSVKRTNRAWREDVYRMDAQNWNREFEKAAKDVTRKKQAALLFQAAKKGEARIVERLADMDRSLLEVKDKYGWTAAHFAAANDHTAVIKVLAKLAPETLNKKDKCDWTPAHYAARDGHADVIEVLSRIAPETLRGKIENGWTPAHVAASYGQADVIELLAKVARETFNEEDMDRMTPLGRLREAADRVRREDDSLKADEREALANKIAAMLDVNNGHNK